MLQVFADADDEFGSLHAVKGQLERWRGAYPDAYRDAYVSMSAPALMAPFVRLQLLEWDPLHQAQPGQLLRQLLSCCVDCACYMHQPDCCNTDWLTSPTSMGSRDSRQQVSY